MSTANENRAERGQTAWDYWSVIAGVDEDSPQDIISDLLHYFHEYQGLTLQETLSILTTAQMNFEDEVREAQS